MSATQEKPAITRRHRAPIPPLPAGSPPPRRPRRRLVAARGGSRRPWAIPSLLLIAGLALMTAGLLLVAALRPPAPGVRTVVITMRHTHFQPAGIRVDAGTTVRFVLRNTDPIDHEFIVGDEAVHQRHRAGVQARHQGDVPGEISVPSGAVATTSFRFDHPGQVAYVCHLPGHEAYGMAGVVDVR